jgi:hypothetical protein
MRSHRMLAAAGLALLVASCQGTDVAAPKQQTLTPVKTAVLKLAGDQVLAYFEARLSSRDPVMAAFAADEVAAIERLRRVSTITPADDPALDFLYGYPYTFTRINSGSQSGEAAVFAQSRRIRRPTNISAPRPISTGVRRPTTTTMRTVRVRSS